MGNYSNRAAYALLNEAGYDIPEHDEEGLFSHTLCRDLVMQSLMIGLRDRPDITLEYHDHLPRKLELQERAGKTRYMMADVGPFSLVKNGHYRHIAGVEIETGSKRISTLVGYNLAATLPPLFGAAVLFLTPISFLLSTAANSRLLVDRLALALGVALLPLANLLNTGVDMLIAGVSAGTIAYAVHRIRGRR